MSTAAPPPPVQPPQRDQSSTVDRDIARTRRALQRVDLIGALLTLTIGVLLYLLAVSVMEHWVVPGGWSSTARALLLAALAGGVLWYTIRRIVPIFLRPINPAFAARAIEEHSPGLKNSLMNLLMLRGHRREIHSSVYQAIEEQTAERLANVQIDSAVDRAGVLRLGYVLAAVVLVCGLYRVLSPKDIFASAGRVLAPWSDIAAPSRVTVTKIEPGDVSVAKGETVEVSAEVLGLAPDEPVVLKYSTVDKQAVDRPVSMNSETELDYRCLLPGRNSGGVQQELTYWIEAGDARSARHTITVFEKPTIVVQRVRYDYPAYTGLASREDDAGGDITALEGTRVTLFALTNQPIDNAHIDFAADGRNDIRMQADGQEANASFKLALREDRRTQQHSSYVLRYRTPGGQSNDDPPKHTIDVTPDYAPETEVLRPDADVIDVAIGERVRFEIEARDPDFALSDVSLVGEVEGKPMLRKRLLTERYTGRFLGTLAFTPEEVGLQEGQVMEYWSVAEDNRSPEPNLAASTKRKLRVVGGNPRDRHFDQPEDQQGEGQNQSEQQGESGEQGDSDGEGQEGAGGEGGQGEQSGESSDQQGQSGEGGEPDGEGQQQGQGGEGDNQQEGEQQDGQQQGGEQSGDGQQEGDQQDQQSGEDQGQPNGRSGEQGGQQGEQQKVSSEGDDDGEAFERMRDHFAEQEANDQGQSGEGQQQGANQQENGSNDQQQPGAEGGEDPSGQQQPGQQQSDQQQGAGQQQGEQQEGAEQQPGDQQQQPGGEAPPQQGQNEGEQQGQEGQQEQGNQNPREQGDAGAGQRNGEPQQSPDPGQGNQPEDKDPGQQQDGEQPEGSPPSSDQSRDESDTEGGQDGDQSGGGAEGGGQQADQQGQGASGENSAADSGGRSDQQGPGEDTRPGDQQQADGQTGQSDGDQSEGDKPGEGSQQRDGNQGDQPGGEGQQGEQSEGQGEEAQRPDQQQDGQPQSPQNGEGQQQQQDPSEQPPEGQTSQTPGEGPSNSGGKLAPPPEGELAGADDPTVEFANKQTDMVLDKLEDQLAKKDVDRELLDKLGWNQDELRRFVDRWKNLKNEASGTGEQAADARRKLDDALRSLGLGKPGDRGFRSVTAKDRLRELQDSYRGRVPLEFQDEVRAYLKGTASGGKKE